MKKVFTEAEKKSYTKRIFLCIFREDEVSDDTLEKGICESYSTDEVKYSSLDEIPMELKIEAIEDCCFASGLKFDSYDDILQYFYEEFNKIN